MVRMRSGVRFSARARRKLSSHCVSFRALDDVLGRDATVSAPTHGPLLQQRWSAQPRSGCLRREGVRGREGALHRTVARYES
jgi:hypothetical protein